MQGRGFFIRACGSLAIAVNVLIIPIVVPFNALLAQNQRPPQALKPKATAGPTFPSRNSALLAQLLASRPKETDLILKDPAKYRVQVIYTQVIRDAQNRPQLRHHVYRLDTLEYFYAASLAKLPAALVTLHKINELALPEFNKYSRMEVGQQGSCQWGETRHPGAKNGIPTLAQCIKESFLVSDNIAYNRLYEFCGQQYLNETLWAKGYHSARLLMRFNVLCSTDENRRTNPFVFYGDDGQEVYQQAAQENPVLWKADAERTLVGTSQMDLNGKVMDGPFDFSYFNFISLKDLHELLIAAMLPGALPKQRRFHLTASDYSFLQENLSMYPMESIYPRYDTTEFYATRFKYLFYGAEKTKPLPYLRIFNKVGLGYGFLTDCAYFVDFRNQVEFFLSATLYTNANERVGDGVYEFNQVGFPFFKALGQAVYAYEKNRVRQVKPNLANFRHDYRDE